MAIFSKKPENEEIQQEAPAAGTVSAGPEGIAVITSSRASSIVVPRLSEKASALTRLNKYVFKVEGKVNKVQLRQAVEKAYDVKIARINMISVKGKYRRSGRSFGKTSDFKKAIVTLKPGSKKIDLIEAP